MTPPLGIDVSEFQGTIDWHKVAESGVTFAFARATYGANKVDSRYPANAKVMRDAGVIPGAYHFLTHHPVKDQAAAFVRWAYPDHLHALDVEYAHVDVKGWIDAYRQHYPTKPLVIYTGRDLWHAATPLQGTGSPLWLAGHQPNAYVPGSGTLATQWAKVGSAHGGLPWGGWNTWTFMQFTDKANIPGITGHVDGDAFNGTLPQLRALLLEETTDMDTTTVIDVPGSNPATTTTVGHAIGAVYEVAASDIWGETARSAAAAATSAAQTYASNLGIQHQLTALQTTLAGLTMPTTLPVDVEALAVSLVAHLIAQGHVVLEAEAKAIADEFIARIKAALPA